MMEYYGKLNFRPLVLPTTRWLTCYLFCVLNWCPRAAYFTGKLDLRERYKVALAISSMISEKKCPNLDFQFSKSSSKSLVLMCFIREELTNRLGIQSNTFWTANFLTCNEIKERHSRELRIILYAFIYLLELNSITPQSHT